MSNESKLTIEELEAQRAVIDAEIDKRTKEEGGVRVPQQKESPDYGPLTQLLQTNVSAIALYGYAGKDFEYYVFETAMNCVYGKKIWDWWKRNYKGE